MSLQPKARPTTVLPSRYASLPAANPPRQSAGGYDNDGGPGNGVYIGRNFIGIGISAVHDAVLRSGARMPGNLFISFHVLLLWLEV